MAMTDSAPSQSFEPGNHPDLKPPLGESGLLNWLKRNLFSSPLSIFLTLVTLWALWKTVPGIIDWIFVDAVFSADSRAACREINTGACWAFIEKRMDQFIYGFYPEESRWRVILSFILLPFALAPLLFEKIPYRRQLFFFSLFFPVLVYFLLLGGNIGPELEGNWLLVLAAWILLPVLLIFAAKRFVYKDRPMQGMVPWLVLYGLILALVYLGRLFGLEPVTTDQFGGFMLTVVIGVTGIVCSLPIGILLALGRQSDLTVLRTLCVLFIEFIRGVPLITLLFVASTMLNYFLPPGTNFDLLLRVLIMVTLFSAAYIAEVVRGGLQAIPKGQTEAAEAMGLKYWPAMRLIVLPQALKISIPGIVNTFIGLFKDTTLVVIIGLLDPLGIGRASLSDSKWQGLSTEVYVFIALFFFICCFAMARYSLYLENKLHTGHRN